MTESKAAIAVQSSSTNARTQEWARQFDEGQIPSPSSSLSGTSTYAADVAPLRWFGLLAGDATNAEWHFSPISPNLLSSQAPAPNNIAAYTSGGFQPLTGLVQGSYTTAVIPHEAIELTDFETSLSGYFVHNLSRWIDLTDPHDHFSVMVPHIALRNQGLMKAILALAARHLSIKPRPDLAVDRTLAVQYYYETLQYLQQAMKSEAYLRSQELLVTVLVISTYEMIDGEGKDWERHLKGVFDI